MKKLSKIFLISILAFFLMVPIASATTIEFGDTKNYWPGWGNGSSDDNKDTMGIPDFTGGEAVISDNGYLASLKFNYTSDQSWAIDYWSVLSPGDLFINVLYSEQDTTWDYLVELLNETPGPNNSDPGADSYGLYSISQPLNGDCIKSGKDNQDTWSGYYIRNDHPVALDVTGEPDGLIYFDGWKTLTYVNENLSSTFDLTNQGLSSGIYLGASDFIVAWGVNCANDIVYETMNSPIPEPATMLLFGSGLIGLGIFGRKRFLRK